MKELTSLRFKNPDLKIYISIGGWAVGGEPFSNMVRFPGTRSSFIHSIMHTVSSFGFQGIDIDWEYPAAKDRGMLSRICGTHFGERLLTGAGGREEDTKNFVTFMKELKESCGDQYGLTLTLPSSYCKY